MSKQVTHEQAKQLKMLGYNNSERYFYFYDEPETLYYNIPSDHNTLTRYDNKRYSAPTVSDALDFIREERGLRCAVELVRETNRFGEIRGYKYGGAYIGVDNKEILIEEKPSHPEAEIYLLRAVLEYLEKGGNNE